MKIFLVAGALMLCGVIACSNETSADDPQASVTTTSFTTLAADTVGPVITIPSSDVEMTARLGGVLRLEGDCLYLSDAPVLWSAGTVWDAEAQAVEAPGGQRLIVGRRVDGGGGHLSLDNVEGLGPEVAARVAACVDDPAVGATVLSHVAGAGSPSQP